MFELVEALKLAREQYAQAQEETAKILRFIQATELWQQYEVAKEKEQQAQREVVNADEAVRGKALDIYQETFNKKPAVGISIVINKELIYNAGDATSWAIRHNPQMLKLDTKTFEKYARAILDSAPLEFVTVEEIPSVRITKDL